MRVLETLLMNELYLKIIRRMYEIEFEYFLPNILLPGSIFFWSS